MSNQVKDMTWREVQERLREFPVVIVPIGSTEQHGYHLPIGTDVYLAEALAEKTAEKTGALVYPSIHFGYSWSWRGRIGTVTIRQDMLHFVSHFQFRKNLPVIRNPVTANTSSGM